MWGSRRKFSNTKRKQIKIQKIFYKKFSNIRKWKKNFGSSYRVPNCVAEPKFFLNLDPDLGILFGTKTKNMENLNFKNGDLQKSLWDYLSFAKLFFNFFDENFGSNLWTDLLLDQNCWLQRKRIFLRLHNNFYLFISWKKRPSPPSVPFFQKCAATALKNSQNYLENTVGRQLYVDFILPVP